MKNFKILDSRPPETTQAEVTVNEIPPRFLDKSPTILNKFENHGDPHIVFVAGRDVGESGRAGGDTGIDLMVSIDYTV